MVVTSVDVDAPEPFSMPSGESDPVSDLEETTVLPLRPVFLDSCPVGDDDDDDVCEVVADVVSTVSLRRRGVVKEGARGDMTLSGCYSTNGPVGTRGLSRCLLLLFSAAAAAIADEDEDEDVGAAIVGAATVGAVIAVVGI